MAHARIATERDPLSPAAWEGYGTTLNHAGRFSDGVIACDRALALQPDFTRVLKPKSEALVYLGRFTEAIAVVKKVPSVGTNNKSLQCLVFALGGLKAEAETLFAEFRTDAIHPSYAVRGLIALGRTEEAMAQLTEKGPGRGASLFYLWNPILDPVRNDPRWSKLMADAGLTEAHARAQAWRKTHPPERAK